MRHPILTGASTRGVGLFLLCIITCLTASASGTGGMEFDDLQWSPDGRFLVFSYSFVYDIDEGRTTSRYLAMYDADRDIVWSPHEGESLFIEEFQTTYVANRLGLFAIPYPEGPWQRLLGADTFISESGRPLYYSQQSRLSYDSEDRILNLAVYDPGRSSWYGGGVKPVLFRIQLPEGKVIETVRMAGSPHEWISGEYNEEMLSLFRSHGIQVHPQGTPFPPPPGPRRPPGAPCVLLQEAAPRLTCLDGHVNWFLWTWTKPYTLVVKSIPTLAEPGDELVGVEVLPSGRIRPGENGEPGILGGLSGASPMWECTGALRPMLRYQIQLMHESEWHAGAYVVTLDADGNPCAVRKARNAEGFLAELPSQCGNDAAYAERAPRPGSEVFLCSSGDLRDEAPVLFQNRDDARRFADKTTALLREHLPQQSEEEDQDYDGLFCMATPIDFRRAEGLARNGDDWYVLMLERLWRVVPNTGEIELVLPHRFQRWAAWPSGRYLAGVFTQGWPGNCCQELVLFDLEHNRVRRILPPSAKHRP